MSTRPPIPLIGLASDHRSFLIEYQNRTILASVSYLPLLPVRLRANRLDLEPISEEHWYQRLLNPFIRHYPGQRSLR
jgi:hypothetical protein